jgi:hypothetical protein
MLNPCLVECQFFTNECAKEKGTILHPAPPPFNPDGHYFVFVLRIIAVMRFSIEGGMLYWWLVVSWWYAQAKLVSIYMRLMWIGAGPAT